MLHQTKPMILTALCIALGLILPSAFHLIGAGAVLLPMHIPVLICGMLCGAPYGAICGLIVPLLSSVLTGMPPLFPVALSMMLELCAYGALTGLLYRRFGKPIYLSLILSMLGGRVVSGLANAVLLGIAGKPYGISIFLTGAFVTALPGILLQLVVVPALVVALEKSGLTNRPMPIQKRIAPVSGS